MVTTDELNDFAIIIDKCRNLAVSVNVKVEISIQYVFSQLYAKTLLTICEIYTLLVAGYPEGAMTLARNTYETMIIMTYLYERRDNKDLVERFYDDYSVKTCRDHIKYLEWLREKVTDNEELEFLLNKRNDEEKSLKKKYSAYLSGRNEEKYFKQYWWASKDMSFNQLRKAVGYPENYMYNISCYRVHAGMTGLLRFDNTEEGLLIDSCESGKEMPLRFSLLNFIVSTNLFFGIHNIDCSEVLTDMTKLLKSAN